MIYDPEEEVAMLRIAADELRHKARVSELAFQQNAASLAGLDIQIRDLRDSLKAMKASAVTLLSEYDFVQRTLSAKVKEVVVLLEQQRAFRRDVLKYSHEADVMKRKAESKKRSLPSYGKLLELRK